MAMNRETKRMLQRQGQLAEDGAPDARAPRRPPTPRPSRREKRTSPREFLREVRAELRKVAWPTRAETINYSIIVFVAVVVLTAFVGVLDYVFGEFVLKLFDRDMSDFDDDDQPTTGRHERRRRPSSRRP